MFKEFEDQEKQLFSLKSSEVISLTNISPHADDVNFFTSIRSQGNIPFIDIETPAAFAAARPIQAQYVWEFGENKLLGQEYIERIPTGIYVSTADQNYKPAIGENDSTISHQDIFNYQKGYLYREDNNSNYNFSSTSLYQSSGVKTIDVSKFITIRRSLFKNSIEENSVRIFINNGTPSLSGFLDGASANVLDSTNATAFAGALDLKNS